VKAKANYYKLKLFYFTQHGIKCSKEEHDVDMQCENHHYTLETWKGKSRQDTQDTSGNRRGKKSYHCKKEGNNKKSMQGRRRDAKISKEITVFKTSGR